MSIALSVSALVLLANTQFVHAALPAGWALKANCVSDSTSNRLLAKGYTGWANLTLSICVATCDKGGYIYAGPEYGNECWCGNALNTTGGSGKAVSGCTKPCAGSGNGTCGGNNAIGPLYLKTLTTSSSTIKPASTTKTSTSSKKVSTSSKQTSSSSKKTSSSTKKTSSSTTKTSSSTKKTSTTSSKKTTSTTSSTKTSSTSSKKTSSTSQTASKTSTTTSKSTSTSSTSTKISSTSSTSSKASSTSSAPTSTATVMNVADLVPGWGLQSPCVADKASPNQLMSFTQVNANVSVNRCINTCVSLSYTYAGLEAGNLCNCANSLNYAGGAGVPLPHEQCNTTCAGRSDIFCGGPSLMTVYYKYPVTQSRTYTIQETHIGSNFFLNYDFFTEKDPTNTSTTYISRTRALAAQMLYFQNDGAAVANVDNRSYLPMGVFRNSTRFKSINSFDNGLFVFDIQKMPHGCGVWPSLWMLGPNWPAEGEIDIIEGVNTLTNNQMTLHTNNSQCTTNAVPATSVTSDFGRRNCFSPPEVGTGCGYKDNDGAAFGAGFNANGGGVFVVLINDLGIKIWRFQRPSMPPDIPALKPNPQSWGLPKASWPSTPSCNTTKEVRQQQIIWNTAFCGNWAGPQYISNGCGTLQGNYQVAIQSCNKDLMTPYLYPTAAWVINSVRIYKEKIV